MPTAGMESPGTAEVLVHVGVQRAASTYLQERVFRGHPGIHYLAKHKQDYPDWLIRWHYVGPGRFAEERDALERRVRPLLSETMPNVLSSENFCMFGGLALRQAERLAAILPEARIVIVLRDPLERMLSFYRYVVRVYGYFEWFEDLVDWNEPPFVFYKRKPIYLPDYRYDDTLDAYGRIFGTDRLCVLRFEQLTGEPERFWERLSDFAGVSLGPRDANDEPEIALNASPGIESLRSLRLGNLRSAARQAFPGARVEDDGAPAEEVPMPEDLRRRLIERLAGRCAGYY